MILLDHTISRPSWESLAPVQEKKQYKSVETDKMLQYNSIREKLRSPQAQKILRQMRARSRTSRTQMAVSRRMGGRDGLARWTRARRARGDVAGTAATSVDDCDATTGVATVDARAGAGALGKGEATGDCGRGTCSAGIAGVGVDVTESAVDMRKELVAVSPFAAGLASGDGSGRHSRFER